MTNYREDTETDVFSPDRRFTTGAEGKETGTLVLTVRPEKAILRKTIVDRTQPETQESLN